MSHRATTKYCSVSVVLWIFAFFDICWNCCVFSSCNCLTGWLRLLTSLKSSTSRKCIFEFSPTLIRDVNLPQNLNFPSSYVSPSQIDNFRVFSALFRNDDSLCRDILFSLNLFLSMCQGFLVLHICFLPNMSDFVSTMLALLLAMARQQKLPKSLPL